MHYRGFETKELDSWMKWSSCTEDWYTWINHISFVWTLIKCTHANTHCISTPRHKQIHTHGCRTVTKGGQQRCQDHAAVITQILFKSWWNWLSWPPGELRFSSEKKKDKCTHMQLNFGLHIYMSPIKGCFMTVCKIQKSAWSANTDGLMPNVNLCLFSFLKSWTCLSVLWTF